ncbi:MULTISPECIES: hypothetical protein [unclassified Nocardioides]|uniref:hypothetical protein n=1 Tax=unclassified Nocardioides TaxID=2615069 RepID=UPI00105548CF|nr:MULTISPECIES: hypothetical protein [unclassified Nocardioides]
MVAGLALVALGSGACTDDGGSDGTGPDGGSPAGASATERTVETRVSFGVLTGRLPSDARQRLSSQVGAVVDGWIDAAYVGGDYPRRDFSDAWPGFTAGAQQEAHHDRALMSNEDVGDRIDGVELHKSTVKLDVLAVKQHPVGVTARVFVGFRTTGDVEREVRVRGRLFLTHTDRGWRVFGYDVTKGDA